jgi:hypothetical protein
MTRLLILLCASQFSMAYARTIRQLGKTQQTVLLCCRERQISCWQPSLSLLDINDATKQFRTTAQWPAFATAIGDFVAALDLGEESQEPVTIR